VARPAGGFFETGGGEGWAVNTLATGLDYFRGMSDSLERLYLAVIAAKDLDPATSRTAKLFQRGPAKMAKKLAEEAIEVVIDAVNGKTDAVVRESADLLYNLTVLWASAGVRPEHVWDEMARREHLLGIAEKLPKSTVKMAKTIHKELQKAPPPRVARRPIVALESRTLRKRH
jgi:phosphoribosyl-ATP pyrophosphohydrolase